MRMRRRARALVLVAAGATLAGLGVDAPAQAVPATTIDTVTFSAATLNVSGLAMTTQTVHAHMTTSDPQNPLLFVLTSTGGTGTVRAMNVSPTLSSGTWNNGTWTATVYLPSTADGTWTLTDVVELVLGGPTSTAVSGAPTFTVHGTHQPRMSLGVLPNAYPSTSGVVKGRVVDSDTGLGMAGVPVGYSRDTACLNAQPSDGPSTFLVTKTTNADGYYSFSPTNLTGLQCAGIWGAVRHNSDGFSVYPAYRTFRSPVRPAVTAAPSVTSRKVGSPVTVNGTVNAPARNGMGIIVQQLHGRTAWRDVATTTATSSGRWSATVRPNVLGRNVYRAITRVTPGYTTGVSATFVVTGT